MNISILSISIIVITKNLLKNLPSMLKLKVKRRVWVQSWGSGKFAADPIIWYK